MKQKFAKLLLEHNRGLMHLTFLNDAVNRIMTNGINDHDHKILNDSIEFLSSDLKEHCQKEENEVYPDLVKHTSDEMIFEMTEEHKLIFKLLDELNIFLKEMDYNQTGKTLLTILKVKSRLLVEILSDHIKKENNILHKIAQQTFTERDFQYLYKARKEYL